MQNQIMNLLMNQVKAKNPQIFQKVQSMMEKKENPQELLKQITGNYSPEQKTQFREYLKGFGITDEQIKGIDI